MRSATNNIRSFIGNLLGFDRELAAIKKKYEKLLWDPSFEVYSHAGLEEIGKTLGDKYKTVAFIDFDDVRELNNIYGYEEVNRIIRDTLKELSSAAGVFIARWFSGDEVVMLSRNDKDTTENIVANAYLIGTFFNGMPFTYHIEVWDEKVRLFQFIDTLSRKVTQLKKEKDMAGAC